MDPPTSQAPVCIETCGGKKSVCVIGAGASGLTVSKELLAMGKSPLWTSTVDDVV